MSTEGQTHYERRAARQRQLEMMEASASGVLPAMELDVTSSGANNENEIGFASIRQRNQETARRFLYDEDESMQDPARRASVKAHAQLFGPRDTGNLQTVNLMDHEVGVYGEADSRNAGSSFVNSIFGVKNEVPEEHDAVPCDTDFYIGDGSKPVGRATRTSGLCTNLRKNNATGRRLRYLIMGLVLFVIILCVLVISKKEEEYQSEVIFEENTDRFDQIYEAVVRHGISRKDMFEDETSAEHDALRWLAYSDPARLDPADPMLAQRYALAVFYYSSYKDFVRDHGEQDPIEIGDKQYEGVPVPGWHRRDYWLTEKGYCLWYGVQCEPRNIDGTETNQYDDNANIIALDLSFNHLYGQLPRELKGLSSLETVDMSGNNLKGTFPPELGRMFRLKKLDISNNEMTGKLPKEIGFLEGMQIFNLHKNSFTGPVPIDIERMYNLQTLNMDDNQFSGAFPSIKNLADLETLILSNNNFSQKIPESFTNLSNLRELHLEYNGFTGPIPTDLKKLSKLTLIWLQQNKLTGEIPGGLFASNKDLERVDFESNSLSGALPDSIGELENLITLKLNNNEITGPIPEEWKHLKKLKELHLQNNKIKGNLPDSLGTMSVLIELMLDHNHIEGNIPKSLGEATNLETIYLDHNKLTGKVPSEVSGLTKLATMRLEANSLSGEVPAEVCKMNTEGNLSYISADCPDEIKCECCKCF